MLEMGMGMVGTRRPKVKTGMVVDGGWIADQHPSNPKKPCRKKN